jgi:hypothetical protein
MLCLNAHLMALRAQMTLNYLALLLLLPLLLLHLGLPSLVPRGQGWWMPGPLPVRPAGRQAGGGAQQKCCVLSFVR